MDYAPPLQVNVDMGEDILPVPWTPALVSKPSEAVIDCKHAHIVPLHKLRHLVATSRKQAGERIEHWSSDSILQVMYGRVARAALIVTAGQVILHVLLSVHTRHFQ